MSEITVAPPTTVSESPNANGLKRRASEDEEPGSKRQRRSPSQEKTDHPVNSTETAGQKHDTPADTIDTSKPKEPKSAPRKTGAVDEKKRSKRLFGALLGNLNQPSDRTSKRRQEIETRRKAELQKQDEEVQEDKARRTERLREHRIKVQRDEVDEEVMRARHRQMLDQANFLQTKAEPKISYRPWELRSEEEDVIDEQIRKAKDEVDREVEEWENRKEGGVSTPARDEAMQGVESGHKQDDGSGKEAREEEQNDGDKKMSDQPSPDTVTQPPAEGVQDLQPAEPKKEEGPAAEQHESEQNETAAGSSGQKQEQENNEVDEHGDHVVEGEEDTVIY
ncbi:hypothetical protein D0864_00771 [Hortaea werneckii]|uniref:Pinin/SDK/MemA protein domain-containing protein n=1 Tax=Hortaea werneckii TaxID=91943 RepID=A0A3M7HH35_HORWE|nr:hypothetical protein KC352_g13253 [Hortaea werneckii]KAI7571821.1 hypothetical protein KC317_g1305 [Hortaea werneckii]KAI7616926.1 hypothetical protein KC346_g5742 [Hortaea werneckii]KAI7706697.1 hypothetical protein KC322_g5776 [Hortaea werneckii]RMZ12222.1 hypothetical protein D0864_00771 [Hortaea werneckii]